MVCVPCFLLPVLALIWHKFIQPIVLRFYNPWKPVEEKKQACGNGNSSSESGENENNINKCLLGSRTVTPAGDKKNE